MSPPFSVSTTSVSAGWSDVCRPDPERLIRMPCPSDTPAARLERIGRGRLQILADRDELAAPVELDTVARDNAQVEHLVDDSELDMGARGRRGLSTFSGGRAGAPPPGGVSPRGGANPRGSPPPPRPQPRGGARGVRPG